MSCSLQNPFVTLLPFFSSKLTLLLADGGANTVVYLCEKAQIALESPVFFQFPNQTLTTATFINANRAKLTIANTDSTTAIMGAYAALDRCTLSNLIIDGARPALGWDPQGNALIEMGGSNTGQKIDNVKVYEPRGWSAMHLIEGDNNSCSDAVVTNNDIGPSGNSPTGAAQFNRRNKKRATEYAPGQWADGISLACPKSTVTGNTYGVFFSLRSFLSFRLFSSTILTLSLPPLVQYHRTLPRRFLSSSYCR